MKEKEMLCPFKKTTTEEPNPMTGKVTTYERFEVCAGKRCMAYDPPTFGSDRPYCLRLDNPTHN